MVYIKLFLKKLIDKLYIKRSIKMNLHQLLKSSGSFIFDWNSFETKLDAVISFLLRWGWLEEIIYDIFFWCQTCTKVHAQTPTERKRNFSVFSIFSLFFISLFCFSVFLFCFLFPYHIRNNQLYFIEQPINYKIIQQDIHIHIYTTFGFDNSYNRDHYII